MVTPITCSARMPKLSGLCVTYACFPAVGAGLHVNMLEGCLRKLLQAGHRVAICDQVEPQAPRSAEVNRIVAPGPERPVVSPDGRVEGQPNTLAFIGRDGYWKQTPWMFD